MADANGRPIHEAIQTRLSEAVTRAKLPEDWWSGSVGGEIARWKARALTAEERAAQLETELTNLRAQLRATP